jgi:hypothetical protein
MECWSLVKLFAFFSLSHIELVLLGYYANLNKKPVVFDPVGVGATAYRRSTAAGKSYSNHLTTAVTQRLCRAVEHMASYCNQRKCS